MTTSYENRIEMLIKAEQISNKIDALDNKTVKDMALEIMSNRYPDKEWKRSSLKMADCRCIVYQEALFHGYQF